MLLSFYSSCVACLLGPTPRLRFCPAKGAQNRKIKRGGDVIKPSACYCTPSLGTRHCIDFDLGVFPVAKTGYGSLQHVMARSLKKMATTNQRIGWRLR